MQSAELNNSDTSCQGFAAVLDQVQRSRAQQQVEAVGAACLIDQAAQRLKQGGQALHFIEHHESVLARAQGGVSPCDGVFQIADTASRFGALFAMFYVASCTN